MPGFHHTFPLSVFGAGAKDEGTRSHTSVWPLLPGVSCRWSACHTVVREVPRDLQPVLKAPKGKAYGNHRIPLAVD